MTEGGVHGVAGDNGSAPPGLPDGLLVPLFEAAGDVLKDLSPPDVPAAGRRLAAFDRRGLSTPAARTQLRRLLDSEDGFRSRVVERFLARPDVAPLHEGWDARQAAARVTEAAAGGRLPLLASVLCAARPPAWEFGLGLAAAAFERAQQADVAEGRVRDLESQAAGIEEARRRAEEARTAAESQATRLEAELRDERGARRSREQQAAADLADVQRQVDEARAALAEVERRLAAAEARAGREAERAKRAEARAAAARRAHEQLRAAPRPAGPDRNALLDAARLAARLATSLERLVREVPEPDRPVRSAPAVTPPRGPAEAPAPGSASGSGPPHRRAPVRIPPGMMADTVEAAESMVRTPGVVVIVDGYNVSMLAWEGTRLSEQRDRLCHALAELHLRARCQITVVFDGAEVPGVRPVRRPGVAVVFSAPGEEADEVIVAQVSARSLSVPVLVVSSDGWVRSKVEALGAQVLQSDVFLALLHR